MQHSKKFVGGFLLVLSAAAVSQPLIINAETVGEMIQMDGRTAYQELRDKAGAGAAKQTSHASAPEPVAAPVQAPAPAPRPVEPPPALRGIFGVGQAITVALEVGGRTYRVAQGDEAAGWRVLETQANCASLQNMKARGQKPQLLCVEPRPVMPEVRLYQAQPFGVNGLDQPPIPIAR